MARLESGQRAVTGLDDVLPALNERRVEVLVGSERFSAAGTLCPACGWLGGAGVSACPADGSELERLDDVAEAAVELALQQAAEILPLVHLVDELEGHGGIGALLRF